MSAFLLTPLISQPVISRKTQSHNRHHAESCCSGKSCISEQPGAETLMKQLGQINDELGALLEAWKITRQLSDKKPVI